MTTPHTSIAEQVLAEMNATAPDVGELASEPAPGPDDDQVEAASVDDMVDDDMVDVEVDEGDDGPRRRSLSWNDAIERVPPDIARLMRNMQADYTKKTQALANQRRDFVREREALMKGKTTLDEERELPEYDPFNEDSMKARIEQEVNRRLRDVLEPMQAEYETMQAEDDYQKFLVEHPEFEKDVELRSEVQHLLERNESLDLETAYYAARGKKARVDARRERDKKTAKRRATKEAALRGTASPRRGASSKKPARSELKKMSTADILKLAQSLNRD
tara:strand:+ start:739 stop:1566 length:828 start_codon:yes stop_codon:yes gene_type:complete